ncbi:hypothetical protein GJ689_24735 [Rhodoplanes serenus]|uniref:Uncharacterized protein n=1 Tax=Rhodoplanes serenus TaxID=200615 RepID=A0A9X4XS25_9BRAD|nr:hypothetical protein [Rhodoplanes serenus]MTW19401.1 hypothetical protein [Rhodoplanes serenus]
MSETLPTWGYRPGEARLFDLAPGEALPAGWADAPARGHHPHDCERGIPPEPAAPGDAPDRQADAPPKKRKG